LLDQKNIEINNNQNGSALIYILVAIALLAALTASFMDSSSQQTRSQNSAKLTTDIAAQIRIIKSSIDECVLVNPSGDSLAITSTDQKHHPYPLMANHTYLTNVSKNDNVENIGCPGVPGDDPDHAKIFGANSGKFLPPAPNMFNPWRYYAGEDGVFFWIESNKSDIFIEDALTKLDAQFSQCEAEYIDATSGSITLTSDSDIPGGSNLSCASGSRCFRLWIKRITSSDTPDDTLCN